MSLTPSVFFSLLSDDTRLRSMLLIQMECELCVCELMTALEISQPKVSRHLAALRQQDVVTTRRESNWIYYRLHPQLPEWAREVLASTAGASRVDGTLREDHARLQAMWRDADLDLPVSRRSPET
ncbi:transcriptional regulator, ArsR family [Thioalkalivibrio sp. K90mix]|uniref:metalloregulator ArsR/SmtB family transcription factor n=1 Tax=unclassified Thioalkalivibrio TaxID=2621013 RepID=UPI000195A41B|nr:MULTISPECIES: metalloregulator ArsR/SmtB family transcription factor [unclassified Thioalkalivibrio]ADC72105.1 transcriptional regulator, ArsR family [Thioalkalivibrio sp. K90mix]